MIATLILGVALMTPRQESPAPPAPPSLQQLEREIAEVVRKAQRSVVRMNVVIQDDEANGMGVLSFAGIVYTTDGYIVTDGSGVENARSVEVVLENQAHKPGRVVAVDTRTSVAVVKVEAKGLIPARISAPELPAGSFTIVVGNPFGLASGASLGTLSGLNRAIQVDGRRYEGMIQITSPTFPGDCGGLVADSAGRCIGLIHSRFAGTDDDRMAQLIESMGGTVPPAMKQAGATFATPGSSIRFVAERVIKHGRMFRGFAGLTLKPIDDETRTQLKIAAGEGAAVTAIDPGGPAEAAGLRRRDILLTWGGAPVTDVTAIQRGVWELERETRVKVTCLRQGETRSAEITVKIE